MYQIFIITLIIIAHLNVAIGFSTGVVGQQSHKLRFGRSFSLAVSSRARYGPTSRDDSSNIDASDTELTVSEEDVNRLRSLIQKLMVIETYEVHKLLAEHIPFFLSSKPSIFSQVDVLERMVNEHPPDKQEEVMAVIEYIVSYMAEFVKGAFDMEKEHKETLGKILKIMKGINDPNDGKTDIYNMNMKKSAATREEELDDFMASHKFSPGFLRHLDSECERIQNAPKTTSESLRLLEMLRTIRLRVLEEHGKALGEGATVLGQLLAYDDEKEQLAVLQTGLQLRGTDFALDLLKLTEEAIDEFETVGPEVNIESALKNRLKFIHEGIQEYVKSSMKP